MMCEKSSASRFLITTPYRSLDPENKEALQISRFLAAINGLMGDKHDDMVADDMENRQSYDAPVALDSDIRQRLELLISRFPL